MRNNSLAMLATIVGIAILAWWIGFLTPLPALQMFSRPDGPLARR